MLECVRSALPYQITALIGKGGMGEVYRALDLKLKRVSTDNSTPLAVKQRINSDDPAGKELACRNPLLEA